MEFDCGSVSDRTLSQIERIVESPSFAPAAVAAQSKAAMSMCLWVRAVTSYATVSKAAAPLRLRLRDAEHALRSANDELSAKRRQLDVRFSSPPHGRRNL
jgi:dynein heavy chain, axonemal